jgi:hypothetical protein
VDPDFAHAVAEEPAPQARPALDAEDGVYLCPMPLTIPAGNPMLLIRREAFERVGLERVAFDTRFNLTPEEFRVEGQLIVIGPLVGEDTLAGLIEELETIGLVYYDDFFEMSGNWPEWLRLLAFTAAN